MNWNTTDRRKQKSRAALGFAGYLHGMNGYCWKYPEMPGGAPSR
jgi:hypothetical protein